MCETVENECCSKHLDNNALRLGLEVPFNHTRKIVLLRVKGLMFWVVLTLTKTPNTSTNAKSQPKWNDRFKTKTCIQPGSICIHPLLLTVV